MAEEKVYKCATCRFRGYAEKNPGKFLAKLWRWHTGWCPGWKAYIKAVGDPPPPLSEAAALADANVLLDEAAATTGAPETPSAETPAEKEEQS